MEPIVVRSAEGKHNKTAIEWAVIVALIGLTCITVWMHVSASFNAPEAGANASVSRSDAVETTGSIQSQREHRAPRPAESASFWCETGCLPCIGSQEIARRGGPKCSRMQVPAGYDTLPA